MRALPVSTALEALATSGRAANSLITLVGEMEHFHPSHAATGIRLTAYERAGYKMVSPLLVDYRQPDFRDPQIIDREGGPRPLPLCLMLRGIGREQENSVSGAQISHYVNALYKMYARGFRECDMRVVFETLKTYPLPDAHIPLVPPTSLQRIQPNQGPLASEQAAP